ncbi:hypothetical protein [Schlesneria sp. T3-172]|uniref:hypothetical protein n=1 Tax=Schlesneria sphaerica TaxID=3373610 RepID=UPI0037CB8091
MLCATGTPTRNPEAQPLARDGRPSSFIPSPDEIAAHCLVIQGEWSDEERMRRERGEMVGNFTGKSSKSK